MANVAHLVRASVCGTEGRGFNPLHSPQNYSSLAPREAIYFQPLIDRLAGAIQELIAPDHD